MLSRIGKCLRALIAPATGGATETVRTPRPLEPRAGLTRACPDEFERADPGRASPWGRTAILALPPLVTTESSEGRTAAEAPDDGGDAIPINIP
jgi:hypothetical protein